MTEFIELTDSESDKSPRITVRLSSIDAVQQRAAKSKHPYTTLRIHGTYLHVKETAAEIRAALGWETR